MNSVYSSFEVCAAPSQNMRMSTPELRCEGGFKEEGMMMED